MTEINIKGEALLKYVETRSFRKSAKMLVDLLEQLDFTQIESFIDILSDALKSKMGVKIARVFNLLGRKSKDKDKFFEMEIAFIKKHLLLNGEQLLDSFFGTFESSIEIIKGRIFLTNFRFVITGKQKAKRVAPRSPRKVRATPSKIRLVVDIAKDIKEANYEAQYQKGFRKSLNNGFYSANQIQFGSYYPLSYPNEINVNARFLKFSTNISFILNDESVFYGNVIKITRERLINESPEEYQTNLGKSYELITKALNDSTNIQNTLRIINMAKISDIGALLGDFFKKNTGKAWTAKAIINRKDDLNLTNELEQKITEKMILETLDNLHSEGLLNRNIHEDQFFYFL